MGGFARALIALVALALALAAPAAASAFTVTFNHTGAQQQFVVPAGVNEATIDTFGAEGDRSGGGGLGGLGGRATATISVTPGETLFVYVGGEGDDGGFNGGGAGGIGIDRTHGDTVSGAGGGGASDVRRGGSALSDRILVAGGGGGAAPGACHGGAGGGTTGSDGAALDQRGKPCDFGAGGTQTMGGAGGGNGTDGSLGEGGDGGATGNPPGGPGGPGGGGGYFGGGGGGGDNFFPEASNRGGGGGGSGLVPAGGTMETGVRSGHGLVRITYERASPTLETQASPDITIGQGQLTDTATLLDGESPTGTITFNLYRPDDPDCEGEPAFTDTVTVEGNGDYNSAEFTPTEPGTYRWIASYSGDVANESTAGNCNDARENVTVAKAAPALETKASPDITLGHGSLTDTAILADGHQPTGTIVFALYGPGDPDCSGEPVFIDEQAVEGNGDHTSDPFTPTEHGNYRWIASYSGDAANEAAEGACNDPGETARVNKTPPSLEVTVSPNEVAPGESARFVVSFAGGTSPAGQLHLEVLRIDDGICSSFVVYVNDASVNGNRDYAFWVPLRESGSYAMEARYSDPDNDILKTSACEDGEVVTVADDPEIRDAAPTCQGQRATIVAEPGQQTLGTPGNDVIVATPGPDHIHGGGGHDLICGRGGDDKLIGGSGGDEIYGGDGNDSLHGKRGADELRGGGGNDFLGGSRGNDTLHGSAGDDELRGRGGDDSLTGRSGDDELGGGAGDDDLKGNKGDDELHGNSGTDRLHGGAEVDSCHGGFAADLIPATGCESVSSIP